MGLTCVRDEASPKLLQLGEGDGVVQAVVGMLVSVEAQVSQPWTHPSPGHTGGTGREAHVVLQGALVGQRVPIDGAGACARGSRHLVHLEMGP